jgi:hypothetical protein
VTPIAKKATEKRRSSRKDKKQAAKGNKISRQIAGRTGTLEKSSGPERSVLDPRRRRVLRADEVLTEGRATRSNRRLAGDLQNLPTQELDDSESVEELAEEGQNLEGELVESIENAPPADQGAVRTHAPAELEEEIPNTKIETVYKRSEA